MISEYFTQLSGTEPSVGDTIRMVVSTKEPKEYTTRIDLLGEDDLFEGAHYYQDQGTTNKTLWLCPVNQILFGQVPTQIYVTFSNPVASGEQGMRDVLGDAFMDRFDEHFGLNN